MTFNFTGGGGDFFLLKFDSKNYGGQILVKKSSPPSVKLNVIGVSLGLIAYYVFLLETKHFPENSKKCFFQLKKHRKYFEKKLKQMQSAIITYDKKSYVITFTSFG